MRIAVAALVAAAPMAMADGVATWIYDVVTNDGDAIVEQGETATITLALDFSPDVNYPDGPVLGLSAVTFDTIGGTNADSGQITDWMVLNGLADLAGDLTTTDGVSLFGTFATQLIVLGGGFTPDDPIDILRFTWHPDEYAIYEVAYATVTDSMLYVYEGTSPEDAESVIWRSIEASIAFQVVPTPSGLVLFLAAMSLARRRRGRSVRCPRALPPNRVLLSGAAIGAMSISPMALD